jgi:hypothetical protein
MASSELAKRFKLMYEYKLIRNGVTIKQVKRTRDLLVWRGQSVLAGLLSQGAVGTAASVWKVAVSSNSTTPNMNDDSGNPLANEFSPSLGTPVAVDYAFIPADKSNSNWQTIATLTIHGAITITTSSTIRKIGIIDSVAPNNCHIVVEDEVVDVATLINDVCDVTYILQIG